MTCGHLWATSVSSIPLCVCVCVCVSTYHTHHRIWDSFCAWNSLHNLAAHLAFWDITSCKHTRTQDRQRHTHTHTNTHTHISLGMSGTAAVHVLNPFTQKTSSGGHRSALSAATAKNAQRPVCVCVCVCVCTRLHARYTLTLTMSHPTTE